jgi:starch synthase
MIGDSPAPALRSGRRLVVLSSNIPHYAHAAAALDRAGLLAQYISSIALVSGETPARVFPIWVKKKLEDRRIHGVDPERITVLVLPELLQQGSRRVGILSVERSNWLVNHLFDLSTALRMKDCGIFHFVNSVGLYSARKARRRGSIIVCDVRQTHPFSEWGVLKEEHERLGLDATLPGQSYIRKLLAEYSIADVLIVPSSFAKATFLERGFDAERTLVVPYGIDRPKGIPRPQDGRFRVLFVGRITPRKGVPYLLRSFAQLGLHEAELVLAGACDKELRSLLSQLPPRTRYLGEVPQQDLSPLYAEASVFVMPSLEDAQPLVVLEAMAHGVPVIITDRCGSTDFVEDGQEGFVVAIRDVGALTDRMRRLAHDAELAGRMGAKAADRAATLTWQRYGQVLLRAYARILDTTSLNSSPGSSTV